MDDHPIITEYLDALEMLQGRQGHPFARTMRVVPDEGGIYMLCDALNVTTCYYIGLAKGIRSSISYFSDGSSAGATMIADLIGKSLITSRKDAKDWMRGHVMVRWLETKDNPTSDAQLHRFLIAVLQPEYNEER